MDTLNQANPFFIRCIKSNSDKIPNKFDNETVQRQLRYTGMLETVRIRQAGFNVRLTYDEFIQLYRILLPKGLLSSQNDVRNFLATLNLNRDNYQLGCSKVFLRESEKCKLDCKLHQQIMASIVALQRWFRACLERRRFLKVRDAAILLQSYGRMYLVQKNIKRCSAASKIQTFWRGYKCRKWLHKLHTGIVMFQAHCRGYKTRKMLAQYKMHKVIQKQVPSFPSRLHVKVYSDEAFISKESSRVELRNERDEKERRFMDSDESGIDGDAESDHSRLSLRSTLSLPTVGTAHSSQTYCLGNTNVKSDAQPVANFPERLKRDINKSHVTIDYSDLKYAVEGKSTNDFLVSQCRAESHSGSDSHLSPTVRQFAKHKPSHIDKVNTDQWSSSRTDSQSACGTSSASVDSIFFYDNTVVGDIPNKMDSEISKISVASTAGVHWPQTSKQIRNPTEGLKSLPPVRRANREFPKASNDEKQHVHYGYDHTPNKLEQIFGKPELPQRNPRKLKRTYVGSIGEEVTDSSLTDKTALLGNIDATRLIHSDISTSQHRHSQKERSPSSFVQQDTSSTVLSSKCQPHLGLDLHRRNSDPSTKASCIILDHPISSSNSVHQYKQPNTLQDDLKWQNPNTFLMAGHVFRKIQRISKDNLCSFCCGQMDAFITHGYKCTNCKKLFHTKCIQNKSVLQMPCDQCASTLDSGKSSRRKYRKPSRAPYDFRKPEDGKFNLTGTSEFTDSSDQIITGTEELTLMQQFITKKIMIIENEAEKSSEVDRLFKQALREFKDNLIQIYSAASKHGFEAGSLRYKDLIINFVQAMQTVCQREQKENDKDFPLTLGVNAFRGFMNEFMLSRVEEKPGKTKRKKDKKRKVETFKYQGHTFLLTIINIPTACEICNSFFMWPIERGLVCQSCKLTCHKKCYKNATIVCVKQSGIHGDSHRIFGVPLVRLITEDDKIPSVIEKLLRTVELYGLYTEGIYRKSGVVSKVKELKTSMDENPDEVDFETYQVHVLASVLKSFLREMPEPLLTFECYENFITAANLEDLQDRVTTLYDILKKLPPPNYELMERLMFHLARVALHEETNRMSAASLAIVFAPCVLRTNKVVPAQDSLHDISSQTQCIETIIREQLRKVRNTLDDIDTLDTACQAATNRLSSLRSSKVFSPEELAPPNVPSQQPTDDEEHLLVDHIQEIQKEKEHLTSTLPTLTHATSDDDMLSTDDGSLDDVSCLCEQKRPKSSITRSVSGGDPKPNLFPILKRQSSSDVSVKVLDNDEDPIIV